MHHDPTAIIPMRTVKQQVLGLELLRELAELGQRIFTAWDIRPLAKQVGLKEKEIADTIALLEEEGWIAPLRKGIYAITSTVPPSEPAHDFEIAMQLVKPAIISHWSALHYHRLLQEAPDAVYILTKTGATIPRKRKQPGKKSQALFELNGRIFRFVQMKKERIFGLSRRYIRDSAIALTNPERTLIDGLLMPHYCGGFHRILEAFQARNKDLNCARIIQYALKMDVATTKRLGWILEKQGWNPKALGPLLASTIKGFRKLDPHGPEKGPFNRRWMLRENIK